MGFVKVKGRKQYIPINRIVDVAYLDDDRIYVKIEGGYSVEVEQTGGRMNRYKLEDITFYTLPEDIQPVFRGR